MIVFTFSESVRLSTFEPEQLTFQNDPSAPTTTYTLTGGTSTKPFEEIIILQLSVYDLNAIKAAPSLLMTSINDTYLSATAQLIEDTTGNAMVPIRSTDGLQACSFAQDADRPYLTAFTLDLNANTIALRFNETVNASTLIPSAITFLDSPFNPTVNYSLTAESYTTSALTPVVTVQLSRGDVTALKLLPLCTNATGSDCFIVYSSELVVDLLGMSVVERNESDAVQAESIIADTTGPILTAFNIDLDNGTIVLSFSEPVIVNASSVNFTRLIFQDYLTPPYVSHQLTGGTVNSQEDSADVSITLSDGDLNALKVLGICSEPQRCFLEVRTGAFEDLALQPVQPSLGAVSRYVRDYSGPTLVKFALDLSANRVYLVFSEPIDISPGIERLNSAFDRFIVGHDIFAVLQNNATRAADECLTGPGNNCYELNDTAVSSLHHADDPCGNVEPLTSVRQQTVLLQFTDLSYITSLGFGREIGDTYLCLEGMNEVVVRGPFRDYFNNGNNERSCISAVQACTIIPDSRAPSLLGFRLFEDNADYQRTSSVHATTIVLTFSEPVAYDSFDLSDFNFYSDTSATGPNLTLSGGIVETQVGLSGSREVTVLLNNPDTAFLKLNDFIATSVENTYLMIGAGALNDTSGNPINTSPIIQASEVLSDDTAPRLVNFTIDLNTAQLNLTFDDVIDISTFDIRGVTLQDAPTATVAYTLRTAQNITTYDSYTVVIRMNSLELIDLKTLPGVGSNVNNTYITLTAITIDDHRGTDVIAITDTKALQALDVVEDTTPPELLSFDLDLDSSMLFLTFSDSINLNTFNSSGLTLQNQESVTEVTDYYNLTGGSVRRSPLDASVLEVSITEEDLNEIKKNN